MKFVHLLARLTGTFWYITEDALDNITHLLESRLAGVALQTPLFKAEAAGSAAGSPGTAVIPIRGVIGKGLSSLEMACGGADINAIEKAFNQANADPAVQRIVLAIDSPGGTVTGVPELARHIWDTKSKPVQARSDSLIGSAAYYLAAAADEIVVTPTTAVGSIGVVAQVRETLDSTSADGRTRLRVFRSGADKLMGSDGPLSDTQAAHMQERADFLGDMFRAFVTETRPGVTAESMTGLTYFGEDAVKRGLATRVVSSLSELG
ncbi:MAG TPA: S49 family peptidase [Opitutaceae bacterium]